MANLAHATRPAGRLRRQAALLTAASLVLAAFPPVLAAPTGTIRGRAILESGAPATGLVLVVREEATGRHYRAAPTDEKGRFTIEVPAAPGQSYRLTSALTPDGPALPLAAPAPVEIPAPGAVATANVVFSLQKERAQTAAAPGETGPGETGKRAIKPWWKRPGPLVGIVLLGVGLVAVFSSDNEAPASPSSP